MAFGSESQNWYVGAVMGSYDVVMLGGGLAGLTLSLQLKRALPELSVLVLEKRDGDAPTAAHKVGESTVELGTHYLRKVLGLADYLDEHQLPKHGLRFFFASANKGNLASRVELGTKKRAPVPSHQLDRGLLENELARRAQEIGVVVRTGATVKDANLAPLDSQVTFVANHGVQTVKARWVVDASGRAGFLKRKLGYEKPMDHAVNAVWFRLRAEIDIDDWADDAAWRSLVKPGLRRLGTIHLMDSGYWVWLIPLVSGCTSIGIVADPNLHPLEGLNRFERALSWLKAHEPKCAEVVEQHKGEVLDFRVLKHYAHHTERFYSGDGWGMTGDAGAFLDPFYSPGTDFIAMSNTWLTDLIVRDHKGERFHSRASLYEKTHSTIIGTWLSVYQDKYPLMGTTQCMVAKIFWDFATYWGILVPLYVNQGFTNLEVLQDLVQSSSSTLRRLGAVNRRMQEAFAQWAKYDTESFSGRYFDPLDVEFMDRFNREMEASYSPRELVLKLHANMGTLEDVAADMLRRMNVRIQAIGGEALQADFGPAMRAPDPTIEREVGQFWLYEEPAESGKEEVARRLKVVMETFQWGEKLAADQQDIAKLTALLEQSPSEFRSVAYEAAAMVLALRDLQGEKPLSSWQAFLEGPGGDHAAQVAVGLGWALATLELAPAPFLEQVDPLLRARVVDGAGYYNGLFKRRRSMRQQEIPNEHTAHLKAYDQGLGRSLWYTSGGDPSKVAETISAFPEDRRAPLWRGIGVACAYVGGCTEETLRSLCAAAGPHQAQLALAAALVARGRLHAGAPTPCSDRACRVWCGLSAQKAVELTVVHEPSADTLPAEAYDVWLARIGADLSQQAVSP